MSAIQIPRVKATSVLQVLSAGRTTPCLMLCKDEAGIEFEVVVKWRAALDMKATGLVCELLAALLAEDLDLPTPKPFLVDVDTGFIVGEGKPKLATIAKERAGLNFGSQKLPPGVGTWPKDKPIPLLLRPLAAEFLSQPRLPPTIERPRPQLEPLERRPGGFDGRPSKRVS